MANANGDRNLLFGILALQMDFISRDALIRADGNDGRKESRAAWSKDNRQALERRLDGQDLSLLPSNTAFAVAATFLRQGSASRAEQVLRAVQEVHPNDCLVNLRLCAVLYQTPARREEALGFLPAAMAIKPDSPSAHAVLGVLLDDRGRREEAERELRRAIQLKEDDAGAHNNLGKLLVDEGKFGEASSCFQRAIELLPADDSQRGVVQRNISLCRRLMELDDKLPAVLSGEVQAKAPEKVRFATLCKYKGRYATAARLYHEAFAEQPALADALPTGIRYNAARAAALAAAGKGEDADKLDDTERARLRRQALGWLRDDLAAWSKLLDGGPAPGEATVQQTLSHWKADADLAGVRDALDKLPEDERADWKKLWADVDALLKKSM